VSRVWEGQGSALPLPYPAHSLPYTIYPWGRECGEKKGLYWDEESQE